MSFLTLWRHISVATFALAFAIFTIFNLEYPYSVIPAQVVLIAMMLMAIGYVKLPLLFVIEHWRSPLEVRLDALWDTLVTIMVPYTITFLVLFFPTHQGAPVEFGRLLSFSISTIFSTVWQVSLVAFSAMSVGPTLRALKLVR